MSAKSQEVWNVNQLVLKVGKLWTDVNKVFEQLLKSGQFLQELEIFFLISFATQGGF